MSERQVPTIFSPRRVALRQARAERSQASRPDAATWLSETMADDVLDRLSFMRLRPRKALIAGVGAAAVALELEKQGAETTVAESAAPPHPQSLIGAGYDLIVDLARLDTVNDLPGALIQYRAALAPGGILMAAIIGAGSLPVLRRVMLAADGKRPSPRIHPQVDTRAGTMLLERSGFARQVVDGHRLTVRYGSLSRLIGDLREQGLTSALQQAPQPLGKAALARAEAAFAALAEEDGKVSEHFELLTLTGWNA